MAKKHTNRKKEATEERLIQAVGTLLAQEGFRAVGVNAIAKKAGVDKVLIYRYFGGLPQLIAAYGRQGDFWPTVEELSDGMAETIHTLPLGKRLTVLMTNYLHAIQRRPLTQEIMAWEMVERNELTAELEEVRKQRAQQLFHTFAPELQENIITVITLLGAAINYLVVRSRQIRTFNNIDLHSDKGWEQLETAIAQIINSVVSSQSK